MQFGGPRGALRGPWEVLGGLWEALGGALGSLGGSLGILGGSLGFLRGLRGVFWAPWIPLGTPICTPCQRNAEVPNFFFRSKPVGPKQVIRNFCLPLLMRALGPAGESFGTLGGSWGGALGPRGRLRGRREPWGALGVPGGPKGAIWAT